MDDIKKLKAEMEESLPKLKTSQIKRLCDAILELDRRLKVVEGQK